MYIHRLKLRAPELAALWVTRPALEGRLLAGGRVTSIVAGPGFGKSCLAARAAGAWSGPTLWYSADAADADLAVFIAHLEAGLRAMRGQAIDLDAPPVVGSPRELGARLSDTLGEVQGQPLLVFDDVQAMAESRSLEALAEFVDRGYRAGARFVVCGRSMPLPLHRAAAAGQLETITAEDLTFTRSEVDRFLSVAAGDRGQDESVRALAERAHGWPTGLSLIVQSAVAGRVAPSGGLMSGDHSKKYLFEYLAREVLDGLSASDRRFLLETSILDRLETEACDAVTGEARSAAILTSLVDRGLFVFRTSPGAFAAHALFREFLEEQLRREMSADTVACLHRAASAFYRERGDPTGEVGHLVKAGDLEGASAALARSAFSLLRAGAIRATAALMEPLGQARIEADPTLLAVRGRLERERGDWDDALLTLERAIAKAREARDYDALAEAVRFIAPILGSRNDVGRLEGMLTEALSLGEHLPETSVTSLRMTLAAVQLEADRPESALEMYHEITPKLVARGDRAAQGLVLHNMAVAQLRRGDIFAGLSTYERALKLKEGAGQLASLLHTLGDLIYVKTLIGDLDEADQLVDRLLASAEDVGMAATIARAHEQRGLLATLRGDYDRAETAYRLAQTACDPSDVRVLPDIEHGLAQCALHRGDLDQAELLVARAADAYRRAGRHQQLAPLLVTQARCARARQDTHLAARFAADALASAGNGADALLECVTNLEACDVLAVCAATAAGPDCAAWERAAMVAAARGVALIHEREYRFLLRTKSELIERLRPQLRRWRLGAALFPEDRAVDTVASMKLEMLGAFRVIVNGKPVSGDSWKRRKAPELLAYLVSNRGRVVPRSKIVDLYWPESDADAAHDSLRVTITAIRKAAGDIVRYEANGYRFAPPPEVSIDVDAFDAAIARARDAETRGDLDAARNAYGEATDVYRGEYLEGFAEAAWTLRERERLRADALEALRWLARDARGSSDAARLRSALERVLEISPFDLDAVRMRLDLLVRDQRAADAVRDYAAWRQRYEHEIGAKAPAIWDDGRPDEVHSKQAAAPRRESLEGAESK